jgi:hypothetical protein
LIWTRCRSVVDGPCHHRLVVAEDAREDHTPEQAHGQKTHRSYPQWKDKAAAVGSRTVRSSPLSRRLPRHGRPPPLGIVRLDDFTSPKRSCHCRRLDAVEAEQAAPDEVWAAG